MSEQEPHKIDETFRSIIERMSLEPPAANLDGIRANVLQLQLGRAKTENSWLKAALGITMLLLGGSGYLLTQNTATTESTKQTPVAANTIVVHRTDTVYLTRIEQVYIRVPIPEAIDDGPDLSQSNTALIDNKASEPLPNEETTTLNTENSPEIYQANNPLKKTNISAKKDIFTKRQRFNQNLNNTGEVRKQTANSTDTQPNTEEKIADAKDNALLPINSILMGNITGKRQINSVHLDLLEPVGYSTDSRLKIPKINYVPHRQTITKVKKPRTPFSERLAVSVYYSPEFNNLYLRRDELEAFEYGHEVVTSTQTVGVRANIKLSEKLSLLAGIESQTSDFEHSGLKKEPLMAQEVNGQPTFIVKTVLGTAQIPNDFYTSNPGVGSSILIEGDDDNFVQSVRVPLAFKYDFYRRKLPLPVRKNIELTLYALGGSYWAIPTKQKMKIEVYEPDGHDFYTTLTQFQNTKTHLGVSAGTGAEVNYGRRWYVFGEPYYQTGIGSMVQNLPVRTFSGGFGLRFGIKYQLK